MDAKITKNRVGHLLSYDWIKILAICAAVVVVWVILFTTIAPRATDGQKFEVYVYLRVSYYTDRFGKLDSLHEKDALSYDVLDYSVNTLQEDSASTVLAAHFGAGQGDVMFISGYEYEETDSDGNKTTTSDLQKFLYSYGGNCVWLGNSADYPLGESTNPNAQSYLGSCRAYLEKYYPDGLGGEMDKSAVESDFRARAKGDNRYKRESQIKAGLEKEYVDVVACPTCGRCAWDCMSLAEKVEKRTFFAKKKCRIAVMGCVVNGPGEAKDADLGIAGGKDECIIFRRGEIGEKIPKENAEEVFLKLVGELIGER